MNKMFLAAVLLMSSASMMADTKPEVKAPEVKAPEVKTAVTDKDAKKKLASSIIDDTMLNDQFKNSMKDALKGTFTPDIFDVFMDEIKKAKDDLVKIYEETFSKEELEKIVEWNKTPTAKKVAEVGPKLGMKVGQIAQGAMTKAMQVMQEKAEKEAKAAKPADAKK